MFRLTVDKFLESAGKKMWNDRKFFWTSKVLLLFVVLLFQGLTYGQTLEPIIVSANEWLYPDVTSYPSASDRIDIHAPRGGYASVQVLINDTVPGDGIKVSCSSGLGVPECYRLLDVFVARNVGQGGGLCREGVDPTPWVTRKAPFRVYDTMQPFDQGGDVVEKNVTALYICFPIARDAVPEVRQGTTTLTIGNQTVNIPTRITVHQATMPEKSRLSITNWYNAGNISRPYGIRQYSEEWFDMYSKLMKTMQRTRQTHIIISLGSIGIEQKEDGTYTFDFSTTKRIMQMAVDAGFQTLELGHLGVRNYSEHEPIWLFYRPGGKKIYATSEEAYFFLAQFLPQWSDFLKENGWYDMSVQHLSDEPTLQTADDYRMLSLITRKFLPGMPLFDAIVHPELRGASDYWIPYNSIYQREQEKWEKLRSMGDEIWVYTCTSPGGKWLNRTLDMELLRPRLMHWGNYRFNIQGYLHWGFNYWQYPNDVDPMEYLIENSIVYRADGTPQGWPAGDSHICYPGNKNGPWMSVRAERMRAGAEDCELLLMIADQDKAKADALCANVLTAFDEYTTDVNVFDANSIKLLEAADALY